MDCVRHVDREVEEAVLISLPWQGTFVCVLCLSINFFFLKRTLTQTLLTSSSTAGYVDSRWMVMDIATSTTFFYQLIIILFPFL